MSTHLCLRNRLDGGGGNFEGSGALGAGIVDTGAEVDVAGGHIEVEVEGNAVVFSEGPLVGTNGEVDGANEPVEAFAALAVGDERDLDRSAAGSVRTLDQIEILGRKEEADRVVIEGRLERGVVAIGRRAGGRSGRVGLDMKRK